MGKNCLQGYKGQGVKSVCENMKKLENLHPERQINDNNK